MAETYSRKLSAGIGLMVAGVIALTVGADVAPDPEISTALAIGGGLLITLVGVWSFRLTERRNDYDERYLKIGLRGTAVSLWVFFWAVAVWTTLERSTDLTTPVLEPLTWLMIVPFLVLPSTIWYYGRVM
ncbi:hypothetical protein Natpe_3403 [Natrinema pellirubrum DSM 15624]|uniref:Uncharacterized protein n=2 Tax=Natrinema pellirubrum (strain DSM 15624 / CIP 106293 / JCM 10476 / NCIMB 786 / 157) TaxID=797303 RepID=L0JPM3_NATP1|nr:hypothetical protein [Natrinema pellirubrum]AGB33189.1 hypothetical protein Natpe_3403 [Natrinema pellirubrum DSM 15624]